MRLCGKLPQGALQILQLLLHLRLRDGIVLGGGFHLVEERSDLDSFGRRGPAQEMLVKNVKGAR